MIRKFCKELKHAAYESLVKPLPPQEHKKRERLIEIGTGILAFSTAIVFYNNDPFTQKVSIDEKLNTSFFNLMLITTMTAAVVVTADRLIDKYDDYRNRPYDEINYPGLTVAQQKATTHRDITNYEVIEVTIQNQPPLNEP